MDWEHQTIGQALKNAVTTWGDREAIGSKDERLSYNQLYDRVCRLAVGLKKIGVKKGDSVATIFGINPEFIPLSYALNMLGAILVPINVGFRSVELGFILKQADVKTVVTMDKLRHGNYLDILAEIDPKIPTCKREKIESDVLPCLERIVTFSPESLTYSHSYDWNEVMGLGSDYTPEQIDTLLAAVQPDDMCLIMFTSGSTGFPKGVMHKQSTVLGIGYNYMNKTFNITPEHRLCCSSPFYHVSGYVYNVLGPILQGSFMYVNEFIPDEILTIIEKERIAVSGGFDAHFNGILNSPLYGKTDLSTIKFVMLGTGPEWYDRVKKIFPNTELVATQYGFTEGTGVTSWPDETDENIRKFANGKPWPGIEIKVVNPDTGETVPPDVPGELCLRGWSRFLGYYKNPEETKKAIDSDGFFHSGDYGWLDAKGNVYFRGRYKMMIKTGGENVSEREVEVFLESLPGVKLVQVIGLPDPQWGEIVTAVIEEEATSKLTEKAVQDFCQGKIAKFKVPKKVLFVKSDDWPLLGSGKIDKQTLKKFATEKLGR